MFCCRSIVMSALLIYISSDEEIVDLTNDSESSDDVQINQELLEVTEGSKITRQAKSVRYKKEEVGAKTNDQKKAGTSSSNQKSNSEIKPATIAKTNKSKKPPTKFKPKNRSKFDKTDIRVGGFIKDFRVEADEKAPKVYVVKSSALRKKKVWFEPKVARHTLQVKKEKEICEEFKINFYGMPLIENWFKEYLSPDIFDVRTTTVYRIYPKQTGEEKCKLRKKQIELNKDSNNQSKHVGKQNKLTNQKEKSMKEKRGEKMRKNDNQLQIIGFENRSDICEQVAKKRKIETEKSDKEKKRKEKKSDEENKNEEKKVSKKKEKKKKSKKENKNENKQNELPTDNGKSEKEKKVWEERTNEEKRKALTKEGGRRKKKGKRVGKKWRKLRKNPPQITKRHGRKINLKVKSASKNPKVAKIVKLLPPLNPDDYIRPLKVRQKRPKKSKTNCDGSKKAAKKPKVIRVPVEPTRITAPRKAKIAKTSQI